MIGRRCGFRLYATASNGKNIKEMKFAGKRALVMGSEGEGIPQKALAKCDECIEVAGDPGTMKAPGRR